MPMPNIVGKYAQGLEYGEAKTEQARRQPIVEQLEQMKLRQGEQAIKSGEQKSTLQDMLISENKRKRESADMADFGSGAGWAMNQADPDAAWDQVLDQYEREGKPVDQYRGRPDLMPMVRDLNNPDYAKQQAIQQNLKTLIQTLPQEKQAGFSALAAVDPKAATKAYSEQMTSGDSVERLKSLIETLPQDQQRKVISVYNADPKAGIRLASDFIKTSEKPKKAPTVAQGKASGFLKRMESAEGIADKILAEDYEPSAIDRFATGGTFTNWMASAKGQRYWNSASEWTRAKLRHESGAVIGIEEAREEARTYFPVAGDTDSTVEQKKELRRVAMESMGLQAGVTEEDTFGAPAAGIERGGYRFKGGDPSKKSNWEKI